MWRWNWEEEIGCGTEKMREISLACLGLLNGILHSSMSIFLVECEGFQGIESMALNSAERA